MFPSVSISYKGSRKVERVHTAPTAREQQPPPTTELLDPEVVTRGHSFSTFAGNMAMPHFLRLPAM